MWRIAQEALTNVERHAQATRARVLWRCNGVSAALEITDNGQGFPIGTRRAASTPTASSACASGRRASGPPSSCRARWAGAPGSAAA